MESQSSFAIYQGIRPAIKMELILAYPDASLPSELCYRNIDEFLSSKKSNVTSKYSSIMIFSGNTLVSHEKISEVVEYLEPNCPVTIKYTHGRGIKSSDALDEVKLAGLLSIETISEGDIFEIKGVHTQKAVQRPRRSKDALKAVLASSDAPSKLIDDSSLLKEEDLTKSEIVADGSEECGPKAKKKACKNCSCGLKEIEESEEKKDNSVKFIDTSNAKSSCGNVIITCDFLSFVLILLFIFFSVI